MGSSYIFEQYMPDIERIRVKELKTRDEWYELSQILRLSGIGPSMLGNLAQYHANPPRSKWEVRLWRPGEGCMTRATGRTIDDAWLRAVWFGKGTVFAPHNTWPEWLDCYHGAKKQISGKPDVDRASRQLLMGGIGVEIRRIAPCA